MVLCSVGVFREPDPIADRDVNILPLEHAELPRFVQRQVLLDAVLLDDDSSLLSAKDLPLLAAFKALFLHPLRTAPLPSCEIRLSVLAHK